MGKSAIGQEQMNAYLHAWVHGVRLLSRHAQLESHAFVLFGPFLRSGGYGWLLQCRAAPSYGD